MVGGGRLRNHVAHESDKDDRENQNREIRVEGREISQTHAAGDHEVAAQPTE